MNAEAVTHFPNTLENAENGSGVASAEPSDEVLLKQVVHGQRQALAVLFKRHARSVHNITRRILRDETEADELLQDIFLYISQRAALFNPSKTSARSWIYHVTYHRAFDRRRYLSARHFYNMRDLNDGVISSRDDQAEIMFDGIAAKHLMEKFQYHLSKEQRETIHLYFVEGYSLREIAERTGQALGNVRNHYYRGLERLRSYVLKEKVPSK